MAIESSASFPGETFRSTGDAALAHRSSMATNKAVKPSYYSCCRIRYLDTENLLFGCLNDIIANLVGRIFR